jgi:hypothetical protein
MKRISIISIALLSMALLVTTGCRKYARIIGNNQMISERRTLVSFDKVENNGVFNVYIRHDSTFTATVEAESNLIPYIRTRVNGNTLVIDTREELENHAPMSIFVTAPNLQGAYLNGSGTVDIDSLDTQYLEVVLSGSGRMSGYTTANTCVARISGSGSIDLESFSNVFNARISGSGDMDLFGETTNGDFSISGSGNIRSYNFVQKTCISTISGSGNMYVNVVDILNVNISGSGSVYYVGDPTVNANITGSGQVIKQ